MKNEAILQDVDAINQPRVLFKPGSWLAKIDFINHLILFNNVLITVLSENNGGKTCFSTLLQNNLDQQVKAITLTVTVPCDRDQIMQEVTSQLHLNYTPSMDLTSIATQVNERKAHVVLMIDNAQHLPETFIREALLALKSQADFGFFHLCIVSDYSVVATLNHLVADEFSHLIHTIELGSLSENETRTYVLQRAMTARLIDRPLTEAQFKQFYQLTRGNLANINNTLKSFVTSCISEQKGENKLTVKRVSLAVAAVLVAGMSYLTFNGLYTTPQTQTLVEAMRDNALQNKQASEDVSKQFSSQILSWEEASTRQFVYSGLPKQQQLDVPDGLEQSKTVALVDKVIVIPTIKLKTQQSTTQTIITQASTESQLVSLPVFKKQLAVKKTVINHGAKYTIQLVASRKKIDIQRLKASKPLLANTQIRQFTRNKSLWYILTIGEYTSRSEAQSHAKKLPSELVQLKPWIRSVSGLGMAG